MQLGTPFTCTANPGIWRTWDATNGYTVALTWTAPSGGTSSYRVRWSSDSYASIQGSPTATTFTKTSLAANASYTFKVCSVNADSVEETTCSGTVTAQTPPTAPASPATSDITDSAGDFSWTAAPGATNQEIKIYTDAACTTSSSTGTDTASPFMKTGLLRDRAYWYQLRSYSTTSLAWGAPTACISFSTANGRTSLTISVDAAAINLGGALSPGSVATASTVVTVQSYGASGYITMGADGLLRNGTNSIPATTSGSVGSPAGAGAGTWTGTGFGFTVATGTSLEAGWASGTKWAALPITSTLIHATGAAFTPNQDNSSTTRVDYKLVVPATQAAGSYSAAITYTAVATP